MLVFDQFDVLTFDCYGTIIDWETGIWEALLPILNAHQVQSTRERVLENFGAYESKVEAGEYRDYKTVLATVLRLMTEEFGFTPEEAEIGGFSHSVKNWPAFPDSTRALQALHKKYKLAIISNIDDDLFAYSQEKLHVDFDWVITAKQVKSYKPSLNNFRVAFERIGLPQNKILHVAQSIFHDIVPAKTLGLTTVWVNRRHGKAGFGATPEAHAQPDLEVPDLASLAEITGVL